MVLLFFFGNKSNKENIGIEFVINLHTKKN